VLHVEEGCVGASAIQLVEPGVRIADLDAQTVAIAQEPLDLVAVLLALRDHDVVVDALTNQGLDDPVHQPLAE